MGEPTMLRGVVILLLVANAAFLAWSRGWLDPLVPAPGAGEREPERLARQLHPHRVTVLSPKAAQAARAAAESASGALSALP